LLHKESIYMYLNVLLVTRNRLNRRLPIPSQPTGKIMAHESGGLRRELSRTIGRIINLVLYLNPAG